jgi:hypothetical protein
MEPVSSRLLMLLSGSSQVDIIKISGVRVQGNGHSCLLRDVTQARVTWTRGKPWRAALWFICSIASVLAASSVGVLCLTAQGSGLHVLGYVILVLVFALMIGGITISYAIAMPTYKLIIEIGRSRFTLASSNDKSAIYRLSEKINKEVDRVERYRAGG